MNSPRNKRHTQINFNRVTDHENEFTSVSGVKNKDAITKRGENRILGKRNENEETRYSEIGLKNLTLVEAVKAGVSASEYIKWRYESPWEHYEKCWDLRLGVKEWITVAERKTSQPNVVAVKTRQSDSLSKLALVKGLEGTGAEKSIRKMQQLRHTNILSVQEVFRFKGISYIVFEYMAYSITYLAGNPHLNEIRLAAILGQILNGLVYLAGEGLENGLLTCSNVLIHPHGDVKIAQLETRNASASNGAHNHIEALSSIATELMNGYAKEDGAAVGVHDLRRWPPGSNAVSFLSETTSVTSVFDLMKHPLLQLPWQKDMLVGLISFATVATHIGYRYPPG